MHNGFTQIHADKDQVEIRYMGVHKDTDEVVELYKVTVNAQDSV